MDGNLNKKHTFGFTTVDGRRLTTSDFGALKQMAAQGRITPETLIEADDKVYVAAKVKGLVFGTPPAAPGQVSGGSPFSLDPPPASSGQVSGGSPFSLDPPPAAPSEPQTIVVKHKKKEESVGCLSWLVFCIVIPCIGGPMCSEIFGIDQDTATGVLAGLGLVMCIVGSIAEMFED